MSIRVVVADDQAMVRAGFRSLLSEGGDIAVVAEAVNGEGAIAAVRRYRPDVVMDIRMPVLDGIAATRQLVAEGSRSRVLVLTTFDLDEYVFDALRAGASGFLLKDSTAEELVAAVRTVASGDALLDPSVTRRVIDAFSRRRLPGRPPNPAHRPRPLEPRDRPRARGQRRHREDAREQHPLQAGAARPGAGRRVRLRERSRRAR